MQIAIRVTLGALVAGALLACGSSSSSTGPTGGHSATIIASSSTTGGGAYGGGGNYFFSPDPDSVNAGTVVTFKIGSVQHNVHFDSGPIALDSIAAATNVSVQRTFSAAGTYTFHCSIHNFSGTLVAK
jgi:plastocyanin